MRTDLNNQEFTNFLGVNLRQERTDIADNEVAKAVNADFNGFIGSMFLRYGRTKQFDSPLNDAVIRRIAKINGYRYAVAGQSLYRDQIRIVNGLASSNLNSTIIPFRPLADSTIWAFIADQAGMLKDNGTALRNWGIAAPVNPPILANSGTGLTGTYQFVYTYARMSGTAIAHESNSSPSASITLANEQVDISSLTASADPQVNKIRIYRTVASGVNFLHEHNVDNGTTTTTSDSLDSALGSEVDSLNDPPPNCSRAAEFQETVFLCGDENNPHYLYFSKRWRPEAVTEFIECGNADYALTALVPVAGALGAFKRITKYRVTGNATTGYIPTEHASRRGTTSPDACVPTEFGIVFPAKDGIFATNLLSQDTQIADLILPLFYGETVNGMAPINWDQASKFAAISYKDRYYFSYASGTNTNPDKVAVYSNTTKKWYFYDHAIRSFFIEEDNDRITGGSTDGFVYILENGSSDGGANISLDVQTKDYFGALPNTRKLFMGYKVDAYVPSGTFTAKFYADGTLKRSVAITGDRTKLLLRLPEGCMGFQWRVAFTYSGTGRPAIYGVSALWLPIGSA